MRLIWFPEPNYASLPPFMRYYGTSTTGIPVVTMYLMGPRTAIPFTLVSLTVWIWSFMGSLGSEVAGGSLDLQIHTQILVMGMLIQLVPILVMKAFDDEAQFYHTLLLKSLKISENKSKAKTMFISRMSHELRSPLQGLLSSSALLRETNTTDDQSTYISIINSCGDLLLNIMEKILDITRIESGRFETQTQPFSLLKLVPAILESVVGLSSAKGLDLLLNFDLNARSYVVHGDQKHLKGILTNLIWNAVKFTDKGSVSVHVSVKEPKDLVAGNKLKIYRFEVRDTGKGIPEKLLADLFEPFTKVHNYHHSEGSGLGLSISKRFTEALGGTIGTKTALGVGSNFWVEIPFLPLDPETIGPGVSLPLNLERAKTPPIGILARPEVLEIVKGYLDYWRLPVQPLEDSRHLQTCPLFIVEEGRICAQRGSKSSPLLENLLTLLPAFAGSQQKGIVISSLGSYHNTKVSLEQKGYSDRLLVIAEPLVPKNLRGGIMKLLGLQASEAGDLAAEEKGEGESDAVPDPPSPVLTLNDAGSSPAASAPREDNVDRLDVLLVEDNPVNQTVMRKLFQKQKITFAITGKAEEGVEIWERHPLGISLILMDIELDGQMTGLEATSIIRQRERDSTPSTESLGKGDRGEEDSTNLKRVQSYIAIMTGRALEEDRREAFSCGCDDFLVKPVSLEKIKDLIATLILKRRI